MRIYLNRAFVAERKAQVSVFDHGFLYGDGVFETLRAYNGVLFRLAPHLRRLKESAERLEIALPHTFPTLIRLLHQTLSVNRLKDALIRISVSRGAGPIGLDPALCRKPTLVIIPWVFKGYPARQYRQGFTASIVSVRRTPAQALDPAIKSSNFLNNILAEIQAKESHADEGLMLTLDGYLTEGSISNLFLVKHRRLYTPDTGLGLLAGITRQLVMTLAAQSGFPVSEARLTPLNLHEADECFLTNTSMEVMPVVQVDGVAIGNGKPGAITRFLHEAYREQVRRECSG